MKRLIIVLLTIVLLTGCASSQFRVIDGMVIQGPEQFYNDITEGLDLLKDNAPKYYTMVIENIRKVYLDEKGDYNGVVSDYSYYLPDNDYESFIEHAHLKAYLIAVTLVHEAVHIDRLKRGVDTGNRDTEEWFAIETEKAVAILINAPDEVLKWTDTKYASKYWEK